MRRLIRLRILFFIGRLIWRFFRRRALKSRKQSGKHYDYEVK